MGVRNQSWYDLNNSRPFPVDDTATRLSDLSESLPSDIIVDLKLRFPETAGRRAWISGITNTPNLVTVIIMGADEDLSVSSFTPLASVSLPQPITPLRPYPLEALYPGAGGWIVFGDAVQGENWWGKFSTPQQALLQPSAARYYKAPPITDISTLNNAGPLTGIVRLEAGNDFEIVKEFREIEGRVVQAVVFRLVETQPEGAGAGVAVANVFEQYVGECGKRPESNNCGEPQPIESISGVLPDCCGNITLDLEGCVELSQITEKALTDSEGNVLSTEPTCGFVINCGLSLAEACVTPDRLPEADGTLPNEYQDLCESVSEVSISVPDVVIEDPGSVSFNEESASVEAAPELPFETLFTNPVSAADFDVKEGEMIYYGVGQYGSLSSNSVAIRNVAVLVDQYFSQYKRLVGEFKLLSGSPSTAYGSRSGASVLHNAAMIMDHRPSSGLNFQYWLAEVDWDGQYLGYPSFRIAFFNGSNYTTYLAVDLTSNISLGQNYRISFVSWPNNNLAGRTWLEATLQTLDNNIVASIGPLSVPNFGETETASFGMHTNRAATAWSRFLLENYYGD
jgi:hypothetical protein